MALIRLPQNYLFAVSCCALGRYTLVRCGFTRMGLNYLEELLDMSASNVFTDKTRVILLCRPCLLLLPPYNSTRDSK